jgi:hypothetical protein
MSTPPTEEMQRLADGLLRWSGTSLFGAKDVAIWWKGPKHVGIGFMGPALSMQRHALGEKPFNNRGYYLDLSLQRAAGLEAAMSGRNAVMQTMDEPDPFLASVLEGVESVATDALGGDDVITRADAVLIPDVGAPWTPKNDPTPWYSAKKRRMFVTKRPEWLIEVELDAGSHIASEYGTRTLGANVCLLAPKIQKCGPQIVGRLPARRATMGGGFAEHYEGCTCPRCHRSFDFLVTHSFEVGRRKHTQDAEAAARMIRDCGGLIYPSLAVAPAPATQFGTTVLVVSIPTVLAGLKPYRGRGAWPIHVYSTDTWTVTHGDLMTRGSIELFEELTGNRDFGVYAHAHFWTLGAPLSSGGPGMNEEVKVLASTSQLATALVKRAKHWPRGMTEEQMQEQKSKLAMSGAYYPIAEAKANGVLPLTCCPLAVVPKDRAAAAQSFLHAAGFDGTIIALNVPTALLKGIEELKDAATWEYAWLVRDAVIQYAEDRPSERIFNVQE